MDMLRLGVARRDITPAIGCNLYGYYPDLYSTELHDPLDVTALVFGQGEKRAALISATVCLIHTELADRIRTLIGQKTGIPADHILLAATHTHSGPNTGGAFGWGEIDKPYCEDIFIPRILEAVSEAAQHLTPVRVGIAAGESHIGINRRQFTGDNRICLGQNPWGPYDPQMTVISFRSEDAVIASIVHYGNHGTAAGHHTAISRDWSGIMLDGLEAVTGGYALFLNGPEGDVGPRISNGKTIGTDGMKYVTELGQRAAEDAIRIYRGIGSYEAMELDIKRGELHLPLQPRISLSEAREGLAQYAGNTRNLAAQRANYYQSVVDSYGEDYRELPELIKPQWLLRLGNTVIVSSGYELFSEIGLRIRSMSDYRVLCLSNTNGSDGYFATESQLCLGGYEIGQFLTGRIQPYGPHADFCFIRETLRNINDKLK